jgi:hypothetical protein
LQGVFQVTDPNTGRPILVYGTFMFNPETNRLVAANYTNLQTGEIFTVQLVNNRGKQEWQYGVGKVQIGPDGKKIQKSTSLSERDVSRGGYASHQVVGSDGVVLYEKADAGQEVTWWHQFKMKFEKGADLSLLGFVAPPGTDLTNLNTLQVNTIYFGGATKTAVDRAGQILGLKNKLDKANESKIRPTVPKDPTPTEVKPTLYDPYGRPVQ